MIDQIKSLVLPILIQNGASSVSIFGSVARNQAKEGSDLDLYVEFKKKPGLFKIVSIQAELEKKTGRKVDLVTKINKFMLPYIKPDLTTIYEQ